LPQLFPASVVAARFHLLAWGASMSKNLRKNESVFIGYFPKRTSLETDWLETANVKEICSVSECISKGPPSWIDLWSHNTATWFFDSEDRAWSVSENLRCDYDMYAYKIYPRLFDGFTEKAWKIEGVPENLEGYEFLGYDVVSREPDVAKWGHSPLSCNQGSREFKVNAFCLIDNFEEALACIKRIASDVADARSIKRPDGTVEYQGKWEPGPYVLFEVYRKKKQSKE
jgi:hypothetical protein